ncbi:MAG: DMT family transporter [Bacteroidales bacterium]|nr:DMT family transporter [Bacteroidales bacterium]
MKDQRLKGVLFASITALTWGFLVIALKMSTTIMDPLTIVWFRFLVAFSILFIYYVIKKPSYLKILRNPPIYLVIASLGLGINYIAFIYGIKLTTASSAQVIIQIGPIFLGFVGLVFFKEKISLRQSIGFMIVGIGLFIFYRDNINKLVGDAEMYNMGVLWVVVAAMAWVVYAAFQKQLVKTYPAQQMNLFIFGLPVLLFLPFIKPACFLELDFANWMLMVYLGLNTLIAYGFLAMAFKYLEANKISVIVTMNPIITFILIGLLTYFEVSWVEPEKLTTRGVLAALLVVVGAITAVTFAKPGKKKEITKLIPTHKDK